MSNSGSDEERDFFATGAGKYVDVDDAITEFRRLAQHKSRTVVSGRLDELNEACGMHWTIKELADYLEKTDDYHYLGNKIEVKGLGGLYFCLRLSREDGSRGLAAYVFLYRSRRNLAADLWDRSGVGSSVTYKGRNNLGFGRPLTVDKIAELEERLDEAITDFIAFINESGGLKKHLVPEV